MVDKKPVKTSEGISKTIEDIDTSVAREPNRNLQNFYQSVGNFFTSKPQPKSGQGAGDKAYPDLVPKPKKATTKKSSGGTTTTAAGQDEFMALLDAMRGGSGGGGGGGSRRTYSDADIASAQAKLQALYSRYAQDILDQQANINTNYSTSATNLGGIYDTATGNVNKSYDAARAEQTRQLLALGMTEQTPTQSFGDQTGQVGSFERLRAAILAQNEASRNNAITNQRLASEAASREGARNIAQTVAQMQQAMTSYSGGGGSSGLSAKDYASLKLREMEMGQNAEIAAAKLASSSRTPVNGAALVNDIMKQNPSLTVEQATAIAKI